MIHDELIKRAVRWLKRSRKSGYGLGMLRYYLTAPGLLKNATLPKYWGVLECHPTLLRRVKIAVPVPNEDVDWISECAILASQWPWKSWKEEE